MNGKPPSKEEKRSARKRFTLLGLGPRFNVNACGSCHEGPVVGGGGPLYRNFVLFGERTAFGASSSLEATLAFIRFLTAKTTKQSHSALRAQFSLNETLCRFLVNC